MILSNIPCQRQRLGGRAHWSSYSMNHLTMTRTLLKLPNLPFTSSSMLINFVSVSFKILNLYRGQQKAIYSFMIPLRKQGKETSLCLNSRRVAGYSHLLRTSHQLGKQSNKSREEQSHYFRRLSTACPSAFATNG